MPHYKCTGCHHEFDHIPEPLDYKNPLCDWCGAPTFILENKIPLEKMCDDVRKSGGWEKWMIKNGFDKIGDKLK